MSQFKKTIKNFLDINIIYSDFPNVIIDICDSINDRFTNKNIDINKYKDLKKKIENFIKKNRYHKNNNNKNYKKQLLYTNKNSKHYFFNNMELILTKYKSNNSHVIENDKLQICLLHNEIKNYSYNFDGVLLNIKTNNIIKIDPIYFPSLDKYHNVETRNTHTYSFPNDKYIDKIDINFIKITNEKNNVVSYQINITSNYTNNHNVINNIEKIINFLK